MEAIAPTITPTVVFLDPALIQDPQFLVKHSNTYHSGRFFQCQLCFKSGHEPLNCEKLSQFTSQISHTGPPIGMTTATSPLPCYWLTDSGASHHVTPDPTSHNFAIPYIGSDQLFIGNGKGLCISHNGSALIRNMNATFKLNDVLLVPKASHNFLSFISLFVIIVLLLPLICLGSI